jgi:SecD/SecF fusion protein
MNLWADQTVEQKIYDGLKQDLPANMSLADFKAADKGHAGIVSSTKVDQLLQMILQHTVCLR